MAVFGGTNTIIKPLKEAQVKEPEDYRVVFLNDDYTTMDFVVMVLMSVFQKTLQEAEKIMQDVHKKGRGTVGVFTWDIAMTKAAQVHAMAKAEEYPLKCIVEKV